LFRQSIKRLSSIYTILRDAGKKVQILKLDIGCGGNKKKGFLGVDISKGEDVDFVMDVCKLDFEDNSIEEVFSRRCIQHIEDDKKALSEIFRVLKPDGVFTLVVASWYGWLYYRLHLSNSCGNYKTFHLYRDSKLRKMLEEVNFTIQSLRHIPSPRGMGYDIEVVCRKEIVQGNNATPQSPAGAEVDRSQSRERIPESDASQARHGKTDYANGLSST